MRDKILIAASLLSADFANLGDDIKRVEAAGADWLHVDVMDGHFVPNISIGPVVIKDARKASRLPLDVHLMIENPQKYIEAFVKAGSDIITFHIEAVKDAAALIRLIKGLGKYAGISVKPNTGISALRPFLDKADLVLIMSVEPGFGGQEFMDIAVPKIKEVRNIFKGDISVDGGVNDRNAPGLIEAGANILVAGSYIFSSNDYKKAIENIRIRKDR